jgi:hypothetical protein
MDNLIGMGPNLEPAPAGWQSAPASFAATSTFTPERFAPGIASGWSGNAVPLLQNP